MAAKKPTESDSSLPDVTGPGKTPAQATSRPLIVKHGKMLKNDPMVIEENDSVAGEKPAEQQSDIAVTRELKIEPDTPPAEELVSLETEQPPAEDTAGKATPAEGGTNEESPAPEDSEPSGSGAVDSLVNEVDAKQADKKQRRELEEHAKELEKVIESKEYFVPLGLESRRRSHNRILWLIIFLLLAGAAGVNIALDAEVLDLGVEPLTDLL